MKKLALLIGVSQYEQGLSPLPAAAKDIEAVKSVLINPKIGGFEERNVTALKNPDRQTIEEAIFSLFLDKRKDDLLLLFFSGHGIKDDEGRLYLATRKTRKSVSGELVSPTAVAARFVHDCMSRSHSKRQIVILDSCFSGAFAEGLSAKDDGRLNIKEQLGGEGRAVLTSSSSTQYSFEQEDQELSLYTRFLIEGLKTGDADLDNDDVISIDELHEYASQRVREVKPELKPEIYSIREGFKIRLAKVFIADPQQRYRKEVIRYGQRGRLSIVSRGILDTFRLKLGISSENAQIIEDSVLEPYREDFERRLLQYENIFTDALQKGNLSISDSTRSELVSLQQHLDLRNEDTVPVEARVEKGLKEYQGKLDEYENIFRESLLKEYPLSSTTSALLEKTKGKLGLRALDASSLESKVRASVEKYRHNLEAYERLFNEAADESHPISADSRKKLESARINLGLSELDAASIESKISAKIQTYKQKLGQYEQALVEATERKRFPDNADKQRLQNMWRSLELKQADVRKIETVIYSQIEHHQSNLDKYKKAYSKAANQKLPLSRKDTQALEKLKIKLGVSDEEAHALGQSVTEEVRSYLDRVKRYEQVLSDAMKYEQNLSESTRDDLRRLQDILELPDDIVRGIEARFLDKQIEEENDFQRRKQDDKISAAVDNVQASVQVSEVEKKGNIENETTESSAHSIYKSSVAKYVGCGVSLEDVQLQKVLSDLQLKLGLSDSVARTIEQEVKSLSALDETNPDERTKADNLFQYEQRCVEFFHAGVPFNDGYVRRELTGLQRNLRISASKARDIERKVLSQKRENLSEVSHRSKAGRSAKSSLSDADTLKDRRNHRQASYRSPFPGWKKSDPSKSDTKAPGRFVLLGVITILSSVSIFMGIKSSMSNALKASHKELVDEVWQLINNEYVDDSFNSVDWDGVRTEYLNRSYADQESAYVAVREMLKQLEDPYTRFMDPSEFRNHQIDTSGELTGVGIQISQEEETNEIVVVAPIDQTPAYEAGLLFGDVITAIDGQSTEEMELSDAVNLIRGPVDSGVTLEVSREGQTMEFALTRARIEIHPVRYSVETGPEGMFGYIRLTQFSANAAAEMRETIQALEEREVTGYLLDLRSNPGGLLFSSIDIAQMWIEEGIIVSTVNRDSTSDEQVANNQALTDRPLVVLVDGGSASASEILSGALQDNDRAVLVGTQTSAKGLVQSVRELADGSGVAVTIAKYLTPSGRDVNKLGIEPDYIVELTDEQRDLLAEDRDKVGTMDDPQYAKALEVLSDSIRTSR